MRRLLDFLVVLALGAGCITAAEVEPAVGAPDVAPAPGRVVSHAGALLLPPDPAFAALDVRLAPTGFRGSEPTVGVTSDGTLFASGGGKEIVRSTDGGLSWELVTAETTDVLAAPKTSLDPWVWVDPASDRVFNAPLYVVCTWMSYSDDLGESWSANPLAGCGTPAHDHQKLTSGPPAEGVEVGDFPSVLYYSYNSFRGEGTVILASYDGGATFTNERVAHEASCHGGIAGPVAVGPDGTAYSPKPTCDGVNVAVSRDSGATWEVTGRVNAVGSADALAHMTDAAVDAAGNAYVTWTGEDGLAYVTVSRDGQAWSEPIQVSPPTLNATVYNVISAGAEGRVVVGYLGTPSSTEGWATKDAESADDDTVWHAYLTFIEGAAGETPTMTTVQVTPDDDPVQMGCIWQSGGSNPCRNLGDFIDLVLLEGRPYLVFSDGCAKCSSGTTSRGAEVTLAIVESGPSLLGGTLAPLTSP